ncbi:MAG: glycosyltransferase [Hominenteromicrobium sp.]
MPFTEEAECDFYITPAPQLNAEFTARGIPEEKLRAYGIPVRKAFRNGRSKDEARRHLRLDPEGIYLLLSGGSIGAGGLRTAIETLLPYLAQQKKSRLIVLCGNNAPLFRQLSSQYAGNTQLQLLESTPEMAAYLQACDIFISKPGGLSSTESAAVGVPLIHITPIPGCESCNAAFFAANGMSVRVDRPETGLLSAVRQLQDFDFVRSMREKQAAIINPHAADDICVLLETFV